MLERRRHPRRDRILFLWTGAIRTLQEEAFKVPGTVLNAAITKERLESSACGQPETSRMSAMQPRC